MTISSAEGTGGWHLVFDLSSLNVCITLTKFKLEMISLVLESIRKGDYMFSTNLKAPYF